MTDPVILDLERLREIYDDDREGMVELLDLTVETTKSQLDTIAAAVEARYAAAARGAAHAIKGASFNVGADETAKLAAELERLSAAAQWEAIPAAQTALREGFARLTERIARFSREG